MTEITTTLTAWATTVRTEPGTDPGTDPGICVTSATVDADGHQQEDGTWIAVSDPQPDGWGQDADDPDWLDEAAADRLLAELGYRRDGQWIRSDAAWGAEVEPTA